ncbi:dicarboxylate/amino acid:cation symporter [Asticcacaulis sp. SL142]|uniref:dicarboxylate/amino acid:cation symporter n=1 Tax=Asticcacaulis sp. SL142 TaxID=2995155 RepID=UPI00226CC2FC|nr:dicarboxylate/amino acid:cation symporter [Asticcacaulis sp. SL142]WAC48739.1 dicarboxylate/amino acid:cation symporter [Asticcacaulis sp. SL142]
MFRWWFGIPLWGRVLMAMTAGVAVGYGLQHALIAFGMHIGVAPDEAKAVAANWIKTYLGPFGDLFVRLLRMLIVPLVLTTLVAGIVALGDPRRLGSIGLKTVVLYFITTIFANIIGIIFGILFQPGRDVNLSAAEAKPVSTETASLSERLLSIVPQNPVQALVDGDILAIIFFSILLGIGIIMAGKSAKVLGDVFTAASEAVLKVTEIVMEFAPLGVFALVSYTVASQGLDALMSIAVLIGCVYAGLIVHMVLVYGWIIKFLLRLPVRRFFTGISDAQAVAYSTASSNATLPVTISNLTEKLGVKPAIAGSVLPLGATINMDGTALYLGILALFAAQVFGYDLGLAEYALIAMTAAVVSVGTAGIPSASLFLLAIVLQTFGTTPEQVALIVGFILPVDRIMDMARTTVNVTGDAAVAVAVAKWEGELDEDIYYGRKAYDAPPEDLDDLYPKR